MYVCIYFYSESPVTSIAVDYITNNVYFTANESLFVCTNSAEHCTQLRCCGVSQVVLAPTFGYNFHLIFSQISRVRELK